MAASLSQSMSSLRLGATKENQGSNVVNVGSKFGVVCRVICINPGPSRGSSPGSFENPVRQVSKFGAPIASDNMKKPATTERVAGATGQVGSTVSALISMFSPKKQAPMVEYDVFCFFLSLRFWPPLPASPVVEVAAFSSVSHTVLYA
jgi:hypothetical protein